MSDMRGLSDRLAALSPEQRALLAARLQSSGVGRLEADTIPRRIPGSLAPLSFAQQRLWFLQCLDPDSAAYNIPSAARLKGTLHPEALRWALQTIMDRHESLRTTFREEGGVPVQVVTEDSTLPLPVTDLSRSPEPEAETRRLAGNESRTPFDLEQGALIRAQLIRLELPTRRRRSTSSSPRAVRATLSLPKGLTDELKALSRGESATLFMTLLAGFKVLLARYSGQEDIVVGTPISGRSHVELEGLIGCFLNTLVLRTDLSGDPSFREVVARIREIALGAYANQELPFERLVEDLQPTRDLAHNPLFQVLFQAGNTPGGGLKLEGLDVSRVPAGGTGSKFDLSFRVRERAGGLSCICAGNADLFDRELLGVMLDQYRSVLGQAVASPDQPISTYSLVTDCTDRVLPNPRVVLAEPAFPLVADLVNRVAMGAPSLAAIEQGGQSWSYGELVASADTLSHTLQASGLDPGAVVALAGRPTFGLVSAMLAILQSGRTMLPIGTD